MYYFYIKLGKSNSLLSYWLELEGKKNPYNHPCIAIYFFNVSIEEYRNIKSPEDLKSLKKKHNIQEEKLDYNRSFRQQIQPFIQLGKTNEMKFITIERRIIYLLKPISEAEDMPDYMIEQYHNDLESINLNKKEIDELKNSLAKVRKVEILKICEKNIPQILLTLNTVRYLNSGTFRKINPKKFIGVYPAIDKLLGHENVPIKKLEFEEILELLSPHQFETLIFLMLTNAEIFSPAWRAGALPDIDITGINYSNSNVITLGNPPIKFPPKEEKKFQVKRKRRQKHYESADYTIAISSLGTDERIKTADWLFPVIMNQDRTREWLEHSLQWYIEGTKYKSIIDIIVEK